MRGKHWGCLVSTYQLFQRQKRSTKVSETVPLVQELADKKAELLRKENGHQDPAPVHQDTRSVEELLSFIEEEERQKQNKGRPKKRKPKKKREESREPGGISGLERKSADRGISPLSNFHPI